jgi:predicted dehydrogenase
VSIGRLWLRGSAGTCYAGNVLVRLASMTVNDVLTSLNRRVRDGLPVRVGIVGLGASPDSWAETAHLPALRAVPGYELRGVSASSLRSAELGALRHGVPHAFASAGELAQHEEIDVIVIAVRVPLHDAAISEVLGAGKLLFSEWPLGVDTAEARSLAERAAQAGSPTKVGLQARFNPPVAYVRDLVADGFVGEVLSSSIVGSGGYWGPETVDVDEYLLDESTGATMRSIAVGHALDAMASVFGEPTDLRMQQVTRRSMIRNSDKDAHVPMTAADQVWFSGRAPGGAVLTGHYRGGMWRGTNLEWEILGTEGELRLSAATTGHVQVQPMSVSGARHGETALQEMPVPDEYVRVQGLDRLQQPQAYIVAHEYEQLLRDLRDGTSLVATWDDAIRRHESIDLTD